ncbi:M1 family metallopeptidase [Cellulomonas biazotea]|uniref:Aminopeptidase N n=1 Tax=Cellulomonas biazotea TaxID=1709 RepID=A0A402DT21_9CELL|nr:M1 family metallopeptidase [Cellulomonas biazotea]GCE77283.1 putative peptidase M1, membrane alanine aminopeptidase [Cellulomonas biazotea]
MSAPVPDPYVPDRTDTGLDVARYDLELDYRVATNRLDGRARVHATALRELDRVVLDLDRLRVSQVLVDGRRPERWAHRGGQLVVRLARRLAAGESVVVEVRYAGHPQPRRGPWGDVGWEELTDGVIVAGQPDGASSWFPCHDTPADKAAFRVEVTTEAGYDVVCNGELTSRTARSSRVRWVYEQAEPTAPYLATVQVGRYERLVTATGPVPQRASVPARLVDAFRHDFGRQAQMMALFVDRFGPYPFPSYGVVVTDDALEIPLEASGLSVFGANHVDGRRGSERLVAHELAHQWFGNSLTARRWHDIWLHEGFACYAEWLWSQESGGRSADAQARTAHARLAALPQDLVVGDPGPDLMFDDRLYKRGALTLHAVRLTVGDDAFFALLRAWTQRHAHGSVSTPELVALGAEVTGQPLGALLDAWLYAPVLPPLPPAGTGR